MVEAYDVTRLKEAALLHKIELHQEEDDELTAEIEEDHIPKKVSAGHRCRQGAIKEACFDG